ncbi:hypothetical protein RE628_00865 [Paenibacillus sp. D2_2]|uniref:hypothetical protein n=1 Tax=Paenibacillus sp. D2_2 TaxID=3073092 RepID=UPI002815AB46|nr:hypothetical protein [Paenibacillus sp. D2_2]WMT41204.1 hypothetical protein RE628_00865 [Paenibacillus sp. D2_2]
MKSFRILSVALSLLLIMQLQPWYVSYAKADPLLIKTPVEDGTWDKSGKYNDLPRILRVTRRTVSMGSRNPPFVSR